MKRAPALREILEGYERFNAWEAEEHKRELRRLTIKENLTQFFELTQFAHALERPQLIRRYRGLLKGTRGTRQEDTS